MDTKKAVYMTQDSQDWQGTTDYIASDDLKRIVNVAVALSRPLLIKGEPGTGKTLLAESVARGLGMPLLTWHIKSTTKARDGLYVYDTVQRLYDSRFQDKDVSDIRQYIEYGPLGQAFAAEERSVVLIDEIDKADIEFPNDLLHELDAMSFRIAETDEVVVAKHRPVVVVTSNNEKELPDAFLRRAIFHYIAFPDESLMAQIVHVHYPDLGKKMMTAAIEAFYALRRLDGIRKRPSTSELIDWLGALIATGLDPSKLDRHGRDLPFLGTLLKREQDLAAVQNGGRH
jgi:MoxR-like ATPase